MRNDGHNVNPFDDFSNQIFTLRLIAYGALGWSYQSPGAQPMALNALRAYGMLFSCLGLFESYGSVNGKAYDGQIFSLSDVTAKPLPPNELGQEGYAGFGGVVISLANIGKPKLSFDTRVIVRRDLGVLNPRTVEGLKRVGLVDSEFERRFEVYGSDQTEARAAITPDFMERLMQFDEDYLGRNIQCAFIGSKLHICLEIDDRFDFNSRPFAKDYKAISTIVLHEIAAVFTVLELGQRLQNTIGVQTDETMDKPRGQYYAEQLNIVKAALKTPPKNWKHAPKIDSDMRYSHFLFDGCFGQMIKPIYRPLSPLWDKRDEN